MKRNKNQERALQTRAAAPTEAWDKARCSRRALLSFLLGAPLVPLAAQQRRPLLTVNPMTSTLAAACEDKIYVFHGATYDVQPLEVTWSFPHDRTEWKS